MTPKFKIGEIVFLRPSHTQRPLGSVYVIIKRLPEYHGEFEYRFRNSYELHECIVRENVRIPAIVTTRSDGSRPPVPIDRGQFGGTVRCIF
jgi:hypothetical protein